MTQNELYPAHENLAEWYYQTSLGARRKYDPSYLVSEYKALLAENQRLREAVIILPDDAEPEVGDVVVAETDTILDDGRLDFTSQSAEYFVRKDLHPFRVKQIIQRNGKPVIYESALNPTPELTTTKEGA